MRDSGDWGSWRGYLTGWPSVMGSSLCEQADEEEKTSRVGMVHRMPVKERKERRAERTALGLVFVFKAMKARQ